MPTSVIGPRHGDLLGFEDREPYDPKPRILSLEIIFFLLINSFNYF